MFDFDALDQVDPPRRPQADRFVQKLWAISDPHTDAKENLEFLERIDENAHARDALIVAGDISDDVEVVRRTFRCLKAKFGWVFFVPGNHDLWVRKQERQDQIDSLGKLALLEQLCAEEGVETRPRRLLLSGSRRGLWIVPLLSWHCPGFDREPDIDKRWGDIPNYENACQDYRLCAWPSPLRQQDGSVAAHLDALNDRLPLQWKAMEKQQVELLLAGKRGSADVVVSFSHFLPLQELLPEKRYLFFPCMAKFVGSPPLGERVAKLAPDVHVFGHTHFGWDQDIGGVRYISPPMGMPRERLERVATISTGKFLEPMHREEQIPEPVLIWEESSGVPQRYTAGWSAFYEEYERDPAETLCLPEHVGSNYVWDEKRWGPKAEVMGWQGRTPAWCFGPAWTKDERERARLERVARAA